MSDLRLVDEGEIRKHMQMMKEAFMTDRVVAYAVEHDGHKMTAFGWLKTATDVVPLAMFLPEEVWATIPHLTHTEGPTRT